MKLLNEKNLAAFAISPHASDKEGFMWKRGQVNKSFQKRWFVLKGNLLFYFEKKGDREPAGVVILEGCTVELCDDDGDPFTFKVSFHGTSTRSYYFRAESNDCMEEWMKAMACASYNYMKLMVAELQQQVEQLEVSAVEHANHTLINLLEDMQMTEAPSSSSSSTKEKMTSHPRPRYNPFNWEGTKIGLSRFAFLTGGPSGVTKFSFPGHLCRPFLDIHRHFGVMISECAGARGGSVQMDLLDVNLINL
ncbi:unnamed protein product [Darwinula stevensoni]|uniref:PH domain-containing protein n=1 Tax=Darwinula stevensoni TaxID=69355 RepID=A0A7R8X494_9CRUS|nr:unnamed protein product [Darwinula stevensoni]CAG0885336.1 unnamed protein product [Darwinula stevensoni]